MNYFNNLSNSQKQLLINMGIYNDKDMPVEFFEKIRSLNDDLNEAELYCVSDYYKPYCYDSFLNLDKLIGTDHDKYKNKSWIKAFYNFQFYQEEKKLRVYIYKILLIMITKTFQR